VATVAGAHLGWWQGGTGPLFVARAEAARRWLAGRGPFATAVLLAAGHWAAAARPMLPRVAGGAGVGYRVAGPALIASGTAWAATLVLLGHALGPLVLTHAGWAPVVLVVALVGYLVRRGSPRPARTGATR
jgi:membrane-associated protein